MLKENFTRHLSEILIFAFLMLLFFIPQQSYAGWHSKADELPGMTDSEMITTTLLLVGGIILVYYLAKQMDKPYEETTSPGDSTNSRIQTDTKAEKNIELNYGGLLNPKECGQKKNRDFGEPTRQILPFIGLKSAGRFPGSIKIKNDLAKQTLIVGFAFKF